MPISETELRRTLEQAFPDAEILIDDLAGDDNHWKATVIAPDFIGLSRVAQHKLVQQAVADKDIHALAIATRTPNP